MCNVFMCSKHMLSVQALKNIVLYVLLAPYDHQQSDLLHRVHEEKKLQKLPVYWSALLHINTTPHSQPSASVCVSLPLLHYMCMNVYC